MNVSLVGMASIVVVVLAGCDDDKGGACEKDRSARVKLERQLAELCAERSKESLMIASAVDTGQLPEFAARIQLALDDWQRHCPPSPIYYELPLTLDAEMTKAAVEKVKAPILRCGDVHPSAHGDVTLAVTVSMFGEVTEVDVVTSPDPDLGTCAASAMRDATFPTTKRGGSFKYPFAF